MNQTDVVTVIIISLMVLRGASQGFVRSISGPLCLIIGAIAGYCALLATHNFYIVLLIALAAPFLLGWMINSMLYIWAGDQPPKISLFSRLAGALVNLAWVGTLLAFTILVVTTFRLQDERLESLRQIMKSSITCRLLEKELLGIAEASPRGSSCPTSECAMDPADAEALSNDETFRTLMANERLQKVIYDPVLREAIDKKDIAKFFTNPTVADMFLDIKLLGKIIKVYPKIRSRISLTAPDR